MVKKSEYEAIKQAAIRRKEQLLQSEPSSPQEPVDNDQLQPASQSVDQESIPMPPETEERSTLGDAARYAGMGLKSFGSRIAGTPGDIQDMLFGIMNHLSGAKPEDVAAFKGKLSEIGIPDVTSSGIKSKVEEMVPSLKAETKNEERYEQGVELFADLVNPLMGEANIARAGLGTVAGMGAQSALENLGMEEYGEPGKAVASIAAMVASGRLRPSDPTIAKKLLESGERLGVSEARLAPLKKYITGKEEAVGMYEAGKAAGLTEKQIAPAMASEGKKKVLGKTAAVRPSTAKAVQDTKSAVGDVYEALKKSGSQIKLDKSQISSIRSELQNIRKDALNVLGGQKGLPEEAKEAIKTLDAYIIDLKNPQSVDTLINTYQILNSEINWNAISAGKKNPLVRVNKAIEQSITNVSPEIGKPFQYMNKMYSKASDLQNLVKKSSAPWHENAITKIVVSAMMKENLGALGAVYGGKKAVQWLSQQLLLNPNFQNIVSTTSKAVAKNSPRLAKMAYQQLKEASLKEAPDDIKKDFNFD